MSALEIGAAFFALSLVLLVAWRVSRAFADAMTAGLRRQLRDWERARGFDKEDDKEDTP